LTRKKHQTNKHPNSIRTINDLQIPKYLYTSNQIKTLADLKKGVNSHTVINPRGGIEGIKLRRPRIIGHGRDGQPIYETVHYDSL
jgi:hypothetical protein